MNRKILAQVCACLRQTPLHPDQQVILGLQMIAWTLMSARRRIKAPLTTDAFLGSPTHEISGAFSSLEAIPDSIGQALAGCFSGMVTAGGKAIRAALELCRKLETEGLLQNFSPIGAVADMLAETRGGPSGSTAELAELIAGLAQVGKKETAYCAWDEYAQLSAWLLPQVRHREILQGAERLHDHLLLRRLRSVPERDRLPGPDLHQQCVHHPHRRSAELHRAGELPRGG